MKWIIAILVVLQVLFYGNSVSANAWYVKPDSTGEVINIQAGIDSCIAGDTVLVAPGIYRGDGNRDLDFRGKPIIVISECSYDTTITDSTVIDCEGSWYPDCHRGFYFHSGETNSSILEGFVIENGSYASWEGAGILCDSSSSPIIRYNTIRNCHALEGGGIMCDSSSPIIVYNTIDSCGGCGIYCYSSSPTISNNEICYSYGGGALSSAGGGLWCIECPLATITYNEVHNNGYDAGINISSSSAIVSNNKIYSNNADCDFCAGGIDAHNSSIIMIKNEVYDNHGGGVIDFYDSEVLMDSNYIHDNTSCSLYELIYLKASSTSTISNNTISSNCSSNRAVISFEGDSTSIINNNIIDGNRGSGIRCESSITIINNTIKENEVPMGGGYHGGGVACYSSSPVIKYNLIFSNYTFSENFGGGIYCESASPTVTNNTIYDNAACRGAGIYCDSQSSPLLSNNIIACNRKLILEGGGIYTESSSLTISCCDVYDNEGGNYIGIPDPTGLNGNISEDPLFCYPYNDDFHLQFDSPCLSGNHPDEYECGLIGALGMGCGSDKPYITEIIDILNDQGRQVSVSWYSSKLDTAGSATPIINYELYRRIDDLPVPYSNEMERMEIGSKIVNTFSGLLYPPGDWHYLFSVPAHGEFTYSTVAPTLEDSCAYNDSTEAGEPLYFSTFFIRASTSVPTTYFDSPIDSGYSIDNLPPAPPSGLAINGTMLQWDDNEEPDLAYYHVFAKEHLDSVYVKVYTVTISEFDVLQSIREGYHHWGVTACDHNGNESDTRVIELLPTGDELEIPLVYALMQNYPNPFNPSTTIQFDIPHRTAVRLSIYNVKGQLVRVLYNGYMEAQRKYIVWDGTDGAGRAVGSGVYFYRLVAGDFAQTKKMVLLK